MTIASGSCGENATWRLEDDNILHIEGTGAMTDYSNAAEVPWYKYRTQIVGVVIGEGITHVGKYNFANHTSMTSVTFPSTLESIGDTTNPSHSFVDCTKLEAVNFPDSLTTIGYYAFNGCKALTSINLNKVKTLGRQAFSHCTGLVEIVVSDELESIPNGAFYGCSALTSVDLKNIQTIDESAFYGCNSLTEIYSNHVRTIGSQAFRDCTSLTSVKLDNIETIGNYAFQECMALETIEFGPNLTSIGNYAFRRSYSSHPSSSSIVQRTFKFFGTKPTFGSYAVGYYTYGTSTTSYDTDDSIVHTTGFGYNSSNDNGKFYSSKCYALKFGDNITYTVDGDTLTLSGSGEMWTYEGNCKAPLDTLSCTKMDIGQGISPNAGVMSSFNSVLTSLTLRCADIVTKLCYGFAYLRSLTVIDAKTIGNSAFYSCPLTKIELPEGLTSIDADAFNGNRCHGIIIPSSVTSIGTGAFTPATNAYRKHMTIVFRGSTIKGICAAPTGMMVYWFCKNESENNNNADYTSNTSNSAHPVMIRVPGGWRVISTDMIDNT